MRKILVPAALAVALALLVFIPVSAGARDIAVGTITADRLNVSTLSAISADLGTITAGSISSVSIFSSTISGGQINIGGGAFTVDTDGDISADLAVIDTGSITSLLVAGEGAAQFNGTIFIDDFPSGTGRFVCHDSGTLYDSGTTCDGSVELLQAQVKDLGADVAVVKGDLAAQVAALQAEVTELRALLLASQQR